MEANKENTNTVTKSEAKKEIKDFSNQELIVTSADLLLKAYGVNVIEVVARLLQLSKAV